MKAQLISFETAKLAKEKSFDWWSRFSFTSYHKDKLHLEDGTSVPFEWKKDELTKD